MNIFAGKTISCHDMEEKDVYGLREYEEERSLSNFFSATYSLFSSFPGQEEDENKMLEAASSIPLTTPNPQHGIGGESVKVSVTWCSK